MTLLRPSTPLIRSGNSVSRAEGGYIWSNGSDCMAVRNLAGQPDPDRITWGSQRRRWCPERQRLIDILFDPRRTRICA